MTTRRITRLIGVCLLAISMIAVGVGPAVAADNSPSGSFFDDDGNTHEGAIEAIRTEGITYGCNPPHNTDYCPKEYVTRGQMAAFLVRALGLPGTAQDFFSDDNGTTFEGDINKLAAAGITKGCNPPDNTLYCPNSIVTRGQMAAFLVRAFGWTDNGGGDHFVDDDGHTFENDIDKLRTAGVTFGCNPPTNDRYCPDDRVSRDQMASFLARALGLPSTPPSLDHSQQIGLYFSFTLSAIGDGCTPDLVSDGQLDTCLVEDFIPAGWDFYLQHGWAVQDWSTLSDMQQQERLAWLDTTEVRYYLNGTRLQPFVETYYDNGSDRMIRTTKFQLPKWLSGVQELTAEWVDGGVIELRIVVDLTMPG